MEPNFEKETASKFEIEASNARSLEWAAGAMARFADEGDEEAVYMLALTLEHPEWEGEMMRQVKVCKPHVSNPEALLTRMKSEFGSFTPEVGGSNEQGQINTSWSERIPDVEARLAEITAYFNPNDGDSPRKVILVPGEQILSSPNSGSSFHIGDTAVILSHAGNLDNVGHEFLHGYINPITEALSGRLPEGEILKLASDKYKIDEMYGEHALSLLNEELIRTYNDVIRTGESLPSKEDFKRKLEGLSDDSFAQVLKNEPQTSKRLEQLGIKSLGELIERSDEYFERYMKNELRERIYRMYCEYNEQKQAQPDIRFKDFFESKADQLFGVRAE